MSEWWTYGLSDLLMFSPDTYYRLIELYLRDQWIARIVALFGSIVLFLLLRRGGLGPSILLILAGAWIWVGWAFHLRRYSTINVAATWFGVGWILEGALLLGLAAYRERIRNRPVTPLADRLGFVLLLLAFLVMPVLDRLQGDDWSRVGTFGLMPDPTAVATLGAVLVSGGPRLLLLPIPLLWCLLGGATLLAMESPYAWLPPLAALLALVGSFGRARSS